MSSGNNRLQVTQVQTRLLLGLWDLSGTENKVTKGKLSDRAGRKKTNAAVYDKIYQQLEEEGAIAVVGNKRVVHVSLTNKGLQVLAEGLKSSDFSFEGTIIGTWVANALLRWMRQNSLSINTSELANGFKSAIASYDEFKLLLLDLFEKLNKGNAYSGLVPIWHLRDELHERVSPNKFNEWMMEMQAQKLLYLQSGEARGATEKQKRDSIESEIRGLLFFASKPL
ncbi:hypothetical protein [Calothrix sp. PCC 6303]|uniref:hypothetical protein n=1 Tax=Calothrix sp. PCC 6303 TaxID=1170562 RepID=UPI0002A02AD4|nr:hypothetical protein [Calothrix sp. PCC 6303]AFZ04398.1 regulatory protein MarR [Calothrix sp. PCC 6303]